MLVSFSLSRLPPLEANRIEIIGDKLTERRWSIEPPLLKLLNIIYCICVAEDDRVRKERADIHQLQTPERGRRAAGPTHLADVNLSSACSRCKGTGEPDLYCSDGHARGLFQFYNSRTLSDSLCAHGPERLFSLVQLLLRLMHSFVPLLHFTLPYLAVFSEAPSDTCDFARIHGRPRARQERDIKC